MGYKAKILFLSVLLMHFLLSPGNVQAQDYQCFLYGSITTVDGDVYEGPIRWNDEEVFLTDYFNSEKINNPYLKYLGKSDQKTLVAKSSKWSSRRGGRYYSRNDISSSFKRKFQCRFGDINSISVTGSESVNLELKDGKFINLEGGSNDVGNKIWIKDKELGLLKIDWNRIDVVKFFRPGNSVEDYFGDPIYGKISTTIGDFVGFIQWDHDERLLEDKLDGRSRDGDISVEFSKIKNIEKLSDGSRIVLHSGRSLTLRSSNDVSRNNRGIIVSIPGIGRIDFPWTQFLSLELTPFPKNTDCMKEFPASERLYGKIKTKKEEEFEGVIVYDLDEAMDSEILNGLNDKLEFSVPFRNIKKIIPKAYNYCMIELKNGNNLYLGDQTDVSDKNAGIIIFTGNDSFKVINWNDIEWIEFI